MKVAVVGGGPVGLFCAYALGLDNHDVTIFEKHSLPVEKTCGEGILYLGKKLLEQYCITPELSRPIQSINFHYGMRSLVNTLGQLSGLGVKRQNLIQAILIQIKKKKNISIEQQQVEASQLNKKFEFIVWANGVHNTQLRQTLHYNRMGMRQHYAAKVNLSSVDVFFSEIGEAYVTPVSEEEFQVSLILFQDKNPAKIIFDKAMQSFPQLLSRFDLSNPLGDLRGAGGFGQENINPSGKNFTTLGDARIFWDGITGEGVSLGLYQGHLLRQSLKQERFDPHRFESKLKASVNHYKIFCCLMLFVSARTWMKKIMFFLIPKVLIRKLVHLSLFKTFL